MEREDEARHVCAHGMAPRADRWIGSSQVYTNTNAMCITC